MNMVTKGHFTWSVITILLYNPLFQLVGAAQKCKLAQNPPAGQNCGIHGRVRYAYEENNYYDDYTYYYDVPAYDRSEPARVATVEGCAALCSRRLFSEQDNQTLGTGPHYFWRGIGWCRSFYVHEETGLCQLGFYETSKSVVKKDKSPYIFYDVSCFECPSTCTQPIGAQLLDNGDFEKDILGPWASKEGTLKRPGKDSKQAWSSPEGFYSNLWQVFNQCEGETYSLSFDYQVSNSSAFSASLGGYGPSEEEQYTVFQSAQTTKETADWRSATIFHATTPVHGGAVFRVGRGALAIDNARVMRVDPAISTIPDSQAFRNGGFQNGKLSPWEGGRRYSVVKPGIRSTLALQYLYNQKKNGGSVRSTLVQLLQNKDPGNYRLSFDYKATGSTLFNDTTQASLPMQFSFISPDSKANTTTNLSLMPGSHAYSALVRINAANALFSLEFIAPNVDYSPIDYAKVIFDNFQLLQLSDV